MNSEKIMGKYEANLFRSLDNGFTIFKFRPQLSASIQLASKLRNGGTIVCKGYLPVINRNIPIEITGVWEASDKGWTFCVQDYTERSYNEMITRDFLKTIKGISDSKAELISNELPNFFEDVKKPGAAYRIAAVADIDIKKAEDIVNTVKVQSDKRDIMKFIFEHKGKLKHVERLFSLYGDEGIERLKNDPYEVGDRIGLSLESCDSVAKKAQMNMRSKKRIDAYIKSFMYKEMMSGNIYVKEWDMVPEISKRLAEDNISNIDVMDTISRSSYVELAVLDNCYVVYLKFMKKAEDVLAHNLLRLQSASTDTVFDDSFVEKAEEMSGIIFAPEQRSAFNLLRATGVGILTGGPGTGKSTTVKGIIDAWEMMYPDSKIKLCAPTGRAAQRMTEATGRPATTIHRLLEYKPFENDADEIQCKNEYDPIDADFIIVDEVSMLDCVLASLFFSAVKTGTLVIFVGDINQLQSVGAGDVLNDMIRSGKIHVERLVKTYRQAADSNIIRNAAEINQGHSALSRAEDFEMIVCDDITGKIVEIIKDYHDPNDLFHCQILSPAHKNNGGVMEINQRLQELLNPSKGPILRYGHNKQFRINDKILMTKNNLEKGYFNGDVGFVKNIDNIEGVMKVDINGKEILLTSQNLEDAELAYAMTIHKSQGSEFPVVIISLPNIQMLKRNLLYTAVTRAKSKVIILQQQGSVQKAVKNNEVGKRNTTLVEKLNILFNTI